MEIEGLVKLNVSQVKNNPELKALYIEKFKAFFGRTPCLTCGGAESDFGLLKKKVLTLGDVNIQPIKNITMKKHELKPAYNGQILTYSAKGVTHRIYGRDITDEFADEFLKNGSKQQLAERKEYFLNIVEVEEVVEEVKKTRKKRK